jgi:hypothetical protein
MVMVVPTKVEIRIHTMQGRHPVPDPYV